MTLLIAVIAAIVSSCVWYCKDSSNEMETGTLALMYWGASLMWSVDAVFEYVELGAAYFTPAVKDMINDTFLGISVVALGLVIWLILVLKVDPKKVFEKK